MSAIVGSCGDENKTRLLVRIGAEITIIARRNHLEVNSENTSDLQIVHLDAETYPTPVGFQELCIITRT